MNAAHLFFVYIGVYPAHEQNVLYYIYRTHYPPVIHLPEVVLNVDDVYGFGC